MDICEPSKTNYRYLMNSITEPKTITTPGSTTRTNTNPKLKFGNRHLP